ncbi:MAG TPA: hypothetical protein VJS12_14970 [Steroidobacteraceae bacterium]|nr:hypothetical protein [Steroidobacteraceae bacterium]
MSKSHSSVVGAVAAVLIAAASAACSRGPATTAESGASSDASNRTLTKRPPIKTVDIADTCSLLPVADVEGVLGKLASPPQRGDDACVFSLPRINNQPVTVSVRLDPTGAQSLEQADGMLGNVFARELSDGKQRTAPARKKREDGWDFHGGVSEVMGWRIGHMAVTMSGSGNFLLPGKQLNALALLIRDRLPDLPVAEPGADPNGGGSPPDPCSLLNRAEAEAVLGKLVVEPFRSSAGSPLADGDGPSCTYFAPGHHTLVITPTRGDAKSLFDMNTGVSDMVRVVAGGADAADTLDGPWDQAADGSTGSVLFLKGDNMLEISYRMSSTDLAGAAQLAAKAIDRL